MAYDWTHEEKNYNNMEKMSIGYHHVTVTKVMRTKKDGSEFVTTKGDSMLLVVITDNTGVEALTSFTLTDKAAWVLSRFMARAGADLEAMNNDNVLPSHFEDEAFAVNQLMGRKLWVCVEQKEGSKYLDITPCKEGDIPVQKLVEAKKVAVAVGDEPIDPSQIPF